MARKNSSDLRTIIDSIKAIHQQIDEAAQSEEFSAFVEGIKETFSFIGTLIIPLKGIMPFVLAEMKEQKITFDDLKESPDAKQQWKEIIKGANQRAAAYKKANDFLSAGSGSIEDALTFKMEAEDVASALLLRDDENTEQELFQKLLHEWFRLDYTKDPEDAIARWRTPEQSELWDAIIRKYRRDFAERVSQETGAPVEQLIDEKKRTQEQSDAAFEIFLQAQRERENILLNSRYASAVKVLKADAKRGKAFTLARMAILYFFAKLPQDAPGIIEPGELTEQEAQEVKNAYDRIIIYENNNPFTGEDTVAFLFSFIRAENPLEQSEIIERVKLIPTDNLLYPVDKPDYKLWDMARDSSKHGGQLELDIFMGTEEEKKKGKQPIITLALTFELPPGVQITKELTAFDKRVYIAVGALWNAGNRTMTVSQIYHMMGYTQRPASSNIAKINESLTKMSFARLYMNNEKEVNIHKKYEKINIDDEPLLAFRRKTAFINGQIVEGAIQVGFEPPMIKFARERNQVEPVTLQLLTTPINKTERNLEIEDYLMWRISRMKKQKGDVRKNQKKILYESIFTYCRIKGRTQKFRTRGVIGKILDHYKAAGFIDGYDTDETGLTIET